MRLLRLGPGNELDVTKDLVHNLPPYAILSHTWGGDDDEVTFQDIQNREGKDKTGYRKILFCGSQARRDGFEYFWVDTCCIDKTNNTELSEAINSMFRWYQEAKKCYVFLADVKENDVTRSLCRSAFRRSSWFTRGWTLQELIAPDSVDFFSSEEQRLGDKKSLEQDIHEVTSIPIRAIQGYSLSEFDMKERISWSNGRKTGRSEDKAYSLLGIVGVYMPLIYGEGERSAMKRLKMAIHTDQDNPGQDPELAVSIIRCLADLRISDPQDDKSRIESTKGGLLEDSYRWILEHEDFLQWRNNEERHLLWIKGDPGKGKTMLLCGITDTLTRAPTSHCFVSYFFCQATDSNLNNAIAVLRGLIYMLARQNQSLAKHVHKEWKVAGLRLFEDDNAWYALTRILTSMLEDRQSSEVVFIVDALDECSEGLPQLLNFIVKQSQTGRAKWLVSSRNWFEVEEQLKTTGDKVQLNLELNEESIVNAVEVYIRHRVDEIAQAKRLNEYRKNEMIAYLTANASYTFLWVALVCQQLQDPNIRSRHIMDELRCFPAGLDALYKRMVASINASRDVDLYREILGTVSTTYRPVSLAELSSLLESESLDDLEDMEEAIRFCGSFLTIRNSIVYFIHQSAKDFLVSTTTSPISAQSLRPKHKSLCMTSLKALSSHLHRDIYGLQEPGVSTADITPPSFDPLASLQYSCVFWIDHLVEADLHSNQQHQEDIMNLVFSFLTKDYLHWLEALSLIGSISLGLSSFAKLFQYIQV